jgi:hypothetical protein
MTNRDIVKGSNRNGNYLAEQNKTNNSGKGENAKT